MRDRVRQSTKFRHVQLRLVNYAAEEQKRGLMSSETFVYILRLFEKTAVNSYVLSFNLKLFRTKGDIKSVIRDYSPRNYVLNV